MPVREDRLEAFVTNLGKYNEGVLAGEWVTFPTTEEELKAVFDRIGIGKEDEFGHIYEEWFISDYDCPIHGVSKLLGEYESLDKLNYFASRLDEMSRSELDQFVAIMESGCDEVSDIDDLINLTYNLDFYEFFPGVVDAEDLGRIYFEESALAASKELGDFVNYFDFAQYGEDCAINENGKFTNKGYIRPSGESWDRYYDGSKEDIPAEYLVTGCGEEREADGKMLVVIVEPEKKPRIEEIDSGLSSLQKIVGGHIEALYPYEDPVALICNEEGKCDGLPLNRALRDGDGEIYDIIAGTFIVSGLTADNFGSLSGELAEKYARQFDQPELFMRVNEKLIVLPLINREQEKEASFKDRDFDVGMETSGLVVPGHMGSWHTKDRCEIDGVNFYLMEHDTLGSQMPCIVVDGKGGLVLDSVFNGFDTDTLEMLKLEVIPVDRLPDPSITVQEMKQYGYAWGGMLPMREAAALEMKPECSVYKLYGDNTSAMVSDKGDIQSHAAKGGIFGVPKSEWVAAQERENYLKTAEMSLEDDYGMIDGMINNGPKEQPAHGEKSSILDRLKAAKAEAKKAKPQEREAHDRKELEL